LQKNVTVLFKGCGCFYFAIVFYLALLVRNIYSGSLSWYMWASPR